MPQNAELEVPELDAYPFPLPVRPDIVVSFAPPTISGTRVGVGTITTGTVFATASGGSGIFVDYFWNRLGGHSQSFAANTPDAAATTFYAEALTVPQTLLDSFELTVTDSLGATGSGIFTVTGTATMPPPLAVSFNPTSAGATIMGAGEILTNYVTGSGSGGTGVFVGYLWEREPGGSQAFEATDPTSATTAFRVTATDVPSTFADVFRLTITDSLGATAFGGINVTGAANSIPPPPEHIISPVFPPAPEQSGDFGIGGGFGQAQRVAALLDRVGEIVLLRRPSTGFQIYIRAKQVELTEPSEIADITLARHRKFAISALRLQQAGFPLPLEPRDQIIDPRDMLYTIIAVQCQARNETQVQYWVIASGDA